MLRSFLSPNFKKKIRLFIRNAEDYIHRTKFASKRSHSRIGELQTEMEIIVREGHLFDNKIENLKLVAGKIDGLIIQPKEVFSFWKIVGEPNIENGFKEGRNLIGGKISSDVGGGICQYSSLLYNFTMNIRDIKIIERHPHSLDIYKDDERFVPLGGDATVSYGFKDFRFQNNLSFPIQLKTEVKKNSLLLQLFSNGVVTSSLLDFKYNDVEGGVWVETLIDGTIISKTFYKRL